MNCAGFAPGILPLATWVKVALPYFPLGNLPAARSPETGAGRVRVSE